ncbi:MAG: hypothetical protein MK008_14275, partial [Bdellovibrionales bacterium]|nr:hypothetical protein [Bdellovibrionales bacterium]
YKQVTIKHKINVGELQKLLSIKNIRISDDKLIDNNGSIVDALVDNGYLYLDKKVWWNKLVKPTFHDFDTQMMVLHEALRLAGIDDDDYKITKEYKNLKKKISSQNNFGSDRDFLCQVDVYKKSISDDGFSYAKKGKHLGSVVHKQDSAVGGSVVKKLFPTQKNRVLFSLAVMGGEGYFRWALAEADKNERDWSVYNRKFISGAKVIYSPYPEHKANNKETTIETDEYLIDIACKTEQRGNQ